jgi:hypothetical protein
MSRRGYLLSYASLTVLQWVFLVVALQRPAYGYVDPGSGMLVVQFVGSVLSGGVFFLRKRLKQFFFPDKSTQVPQRTSGLES